MLPLKDLESLTIIHKKINEEKEKLKEIEKELKLKEDTAKATEMFMEEIEKAIMNSVEKGFFEVKIEIMTEKDTDKTAMLTVLEEIKKQGFKIKGIYTNGYVDINGMTNSLEEFKKKVYPGQYEEKKGLGCWFTSIVPCITWKNIEVNKDYIPPDYKYQTSRLEEKHKKLLDLLEEAEKIIQERNESNG